MGTNKSSHAATEFNTELVPNQGPFQSGESVGGLESSQIDSDVTLVSLSEVISLTSVDSEFSDFDDFDDSDSEDESEEDPEIEAFFGERRMILEDAKMLKSYAVFHLYPERKVETKDSFAFGRNFFDRYNAHEKETFEEAEERAVILEETKALKKFATFHLHPEDPVKKTDANACGRNYFSRPSAVEYLDEDEEQERAKILEEAALLKKYAVFHLHPELPVVSSGLAAVGRNYFMRGSAPDQESVEDANERAKILEEAALLKKFAEFHLHPELPVVSSDPNTCGRNYFMRGSAPDQESVEDANERAKILEEVALLKEFAEFHLHPELPVVSSGLAAVGRNYFMRGSAPDQESVEDANERSKILEEATMLKKYAVFHLHPEKAVVSSGLATVGRNYFMRGSAPDQESVEDANERSKILEEAALLKKFAEFHLHPELPVVSSDPNAFGRNYFCRSTAPLNDMLHGGKSRNGQRHEIKESLAQGNTKHAQTILPYSIKHSTNDGNGVEESTVSRSPSSIMLFGYEDNEAF